MQKETNCIYTEWSGNPTYANEGGNHTDFEAGVAWLWLSDTNTRMEILENMFAMQLWWVSVWYLFVLLLSCQYDCPSRQKQKFEFFFHAFHFPQYLQQRFDIFGNMVILFGYYLATVNED